MEENNNIPDEEIIINTSNSEEYQQTKCSKKINFKIISTVVQAVLLMAVITLFILHFTSNKNNYPSYNLALMDNSREGSGEIVFVNIDSINKNYKLAKILEEDIRAEQSKQETVFNNKQNVLQKKIKQFQENYESGRLTDNQIQLAQEQLMNEKEQLELEYKRVFENLQERQITALQQITDSLSKTVKLVNSVRNASYVLSYQYAGQLLYADPTKDITTEVLTELNRHFIK